MRFSNAFMARVSEVIGPAGPTYGVIAGCCVERHVQESRDGMGLICQWSKSIAGGVNRAPLIFDSSSDTAVAASRTKRRC